MSLSLTGKNVVVIGGSSGMGLATAKLAKELGAKVTIASRSKLKLDQAILQIGDANAIEVDIVSELDIKRLFSEFNSIDHIFISGGRLLIGKILETGMETFRADVNQRFWGPLYVVRYAVPRMNSNGSITFLSGQLASRPPAGAVVTAAMGAAVETLTKGLALELAPLRVNAVAPGLVDTPMFEQNRDEVEKWGEALPAKRMGLAEEVAQAVILLMTNGFITGEVLHVDGGGRLI